MSDIDRKPLTRQDPIIFHFRNKKDFTRGGVTVIYDPVGHCFGISRCDSKDNFNKKVGIKIANDRCLSARYNHLRFFKIWNPETKTFVKTNLMMGKWSDFSHIGNYTIPSWGATVVSFHDVKLAARSLAWGAVEGTDIVID